MGRFVVRSGNFSFMPILFQERPKYFKKMMDAEKRRLPSRKKSLAKRDGNFVLVSRAQPLANHSGVTKPGFDLRQNLVETWLIGGSEPVFRAEMLVMRMCDDLRMVGGLSMALLPRFA
jgi:hypothetical protein